MPTSSPTGAEEEVVEGEREKREEAAQARRLKFAEALDRLKGAE